MRYDFRQIFTSPTFPEDEDKTRAAAILTAIGWSTLLIVVSILLIRIIQGNDANLAEVNGVLAIVIIAIAGVLYLAHQKYVRTASFLLVATLWSGLSYVAWAADGIHDIAFIAYIVPILIAGLLVSWRGAAALTVASILSGWALAYAEAAHFFSPTLDEPLSFARDMTGVFALIGILIYLTITNLRSALEKSRHVAKELAASIRELDQLRASLEHEVEDQTSELKQRATQLEAVSGVAQAIASVQDVDLLLPDITKLVSQQFGYYHVGIFLLDEQRRSATLRAANSQGGLRMLTRRHSLALDSNSIVGYSVSRGEARIALDVGTDSVFFNNPDLPETRSEMAIPLRVAGAVIGALDVQSTETNAFSQDDVHVLTTLANQIAIAIENARLFGETKRALDEARETFEKYAHQEWNSFARQARPRGFRFDGKNVIPVENGYSQPDSAETLAIPLKLRGQVIGILDIRAKNGRRRWTADEMAMLEAAAERAALALENARLVESAQRRAARERAIGDISTKIGAVSNLESILQSAVEELGRKIGGAAEVTLEITTDAGQRSSSLDNG